MSDPVPEGHMRKETARLRSTNSAHGHILRFYTANINLAINNLIQDPVEENRGNPGDTNTLSAIIFHLFVYVS